MSSVVVCKLLVKVLGVGGDGVDGGIHAIFILRCYSFGWADGLNYCHFSTLGATDECLSQVAKLLGFLDRCDKVLEFHVRVTFNSQVVSPYLRRRVVTTRCVVNTP